MTSQNFVSWFKTLGSLTVTALMLAFLAGCGGSGGGGSSVGGGGGPPPAPGAISGFSDGGATALFRIFPLAYAAGPYTLVTTASAHGLVPGDFVDISGTGGAYDGKYEVASTPSSTTFKIDRPFTTNPGSGTFVEASTALVPIAGIVDAGGGNVTITAPDADTLAPGDVIIISGSGSPGYDGTYTIVSIDSPTSFTIGGATYVPTWATNYNTIWQRAGGVVAGCSTTGDTGDILLPAIASIPSRFSGVAPLSVFFDATGTTAPGLTARPFHELVYGWNFGDPAGGATWSRGAHVFSGSTPASKNIASGGVAAHLYETPGIYTVTLTVTDGSNTVSNACVEIAVQDPNVVFGGEDKTVCVSSSGNFTGCPSSDPADHVTSATINTTMATVLADGKRRILFRRGETFSAASQTQLNIAGPGIIGAYGTGAKPRINSSGATTLLRLGAVANAASDWRIMDLEFDGESVTDRVAIGANGHANNIAFVRLDIHDVNRGFSFTSNTLNTHNPPAPALPGSVAPIWDLLSIYDSNIQRTVGGGGGNGVFIESSRLAFIGNLVDDTTGGEHGFRSQYIGKGVISNNTLQFPAGTTAAEAAASPSPTDSAGSNSKNVLTIRAPTFAGSNTFSPGTYTEYVIVSDNKLVGNDSSLLIAATEPQNGTSDERHRHVIWERNWFVAGTVTSSALIMSNTLEDTVRNNIFDMTDAGASTAISVGGNTDTAPPSTLAFFYNNTFYRGDPSTAAFRGINLTAGGTSMVARNNLSYAPFVTGTPRSTLSSAIGGQLSESNNTNDGLVTVDPLFASATPTTPAHFKPTGASHAIAAGIPVPGVLVDFFGLPQPGPPDLGAVAH